MGRPVESLAGIATNKIVRESTARPRPVFFDRKMVTEMSKRSSAENTELKSGLSAKIKNSSALIGIIGMGYVGLPLMLACTAKNLRVVGFDIDAKKVKGLNSRPKPAQARRRHSHWRHARSSTF